MKILTICVFLITVAFFFYILWRDRRAKKNGGPVVNFKDVQKVVIYLKDKKEPVELFLNQDKLD